MHTKEEAPPFQHAESELCTFIVETGEVQPEHPLYIQDKIDKQVQALDPLEADNLIKLLPKINDTNDLHSLTDLGTILVKRTEALFTKTNSLAQNMAMLRDLGMVAASLVRHGLTIGHVAGLEEALYCLGNATDEVPRDSVFSYGPRNPQTPDRMRRFTSTQKEKVFIEAFSSGMEKLSCTIVSLESALLTDDPEAMALHIEQASSNFDAMIRAIVAVHRAIPPEVFTRQLRPYFDPVTVHNIDYLAPGGAQMPVIIIDKLLWGLDQYSPALELYFKENLTYHPALYRKYWEELSQTHSDSLITKVEHMVIENPASAQKAAAALMKFVNTLIRFRVPHLKVANDNFRLRDEDGLGSGGYQPTILETLLEKTKDARTRLQALLN